MTSTATWTSDPNTIAWHLAHDPPGGQVSDEWLRVSMTLNPSATALPSLAEWRPDLRLRANGVKRLPVRSAPRRGAL